MPEIDTRPTETLLEKRDAACKALDELSKVLMQFERASNGIFARPVNEMSASERMATANGLIKLFGEIERARGCEL